MITYALILANQSYTPSVLRQNYGISTVYKNTELLYTPILEKIQGSGFSSSHVWM